MHERGRKSIQRTFVLLSLGILLALALAISLLFLSGERQATREHGAALREEVLRAKRELIQDAVDRTIQHIEFERAACAAERGGCDEAALKERLRRYVRAIRLEGDGYVWINAVLDFRGGDGYAYRFVHPNLPETEGTLLSTRLQDIRGNTPYLTELEGVKAHGSVFFDYWFKKMGSEEIQHKLTYARLYAPYAWIVATGVYLDDVDALVQAGTRRWGQRMRERALVAVALTGVASLLAWLLSLALGRRIDRLYAFFLDEVGHKEAELRRFNLELEAKVALRTRAIEASTRRYLEQRRRLSQELERRVAERTAELEASNAELEAFAYSVSHDLRAPLRHVDGYIGLLERALGAGIDPKSRRHMAAISDAAHRMGRLIDDLLSFSRMARSTLRKERFALGALVREVLDELAPDAAGREVRWRVGELPEVTADRAMLRTVLVNLLSNALKFTRGRGRAEIEIGCAPGGVEDEVFVRDNGVGFDMQHAAKLFGVFQRLHRAEDFEGTGIGLANVRRIVGRHGGRTWAEGKLGDGATFCFSLPRASDEERPLPDLPAPADTTLAS